MIFNGYLVGGNESGYAPFRYRRDRLRRIRRPQRAAVRVDASLGEGWFYEGAGIYRHVWLVKTAPVHVPPVGQLRALHVRRRRRDAQASTEIVNDGDEPALPSWSPACSIRTGNAVAETASAQVTIEPGETQSYRPERIARPRPPVVARDAAPLQAS